MQQRDGGNGGRGQTMQCADVLVIPTYLVMCLDGLMKWVGTTHP